MLNCMNSWASYVIITYMVVRQLGATDATCRTHDPKRNIGIIDWPIGPLLVWEIETNAKKQVTDRGAGKAPC